MPLMWRHSLQTQGIALAEEVRAGLATTLYRVTSLVPVSKLR